MPNNPQSQEPIPQPAAPEPQQVVSIMTPPVEPPIQQSPVQPPVQPGQAQPPSAALPSEASAKLGETMPKSKTSFVTIFGLILLIGSLLALGWYFLSEKLLKQTPVTSYEECLIAKGSLIQETYPQVCVTKSGERFTEPVSSPSPTPFDETVDWKTYSNEKYGFSFKFPSNLSDLKNQGGTSATWAIRPLSLINLGDKATIQEGSDAPYDGFSVYVIPNLGTLSFDDFLNKEVQVASDRPRGIESTEITKITVGNQPAAIINYGYGVGIKGYYIQSSDNKSVIVLTRTNKTDNFLITFDKILSTFKFLEATPSASPTATPSSSLR